MAKKVVRVVTLLPGDEVRDRSGFVPKGEWDRKTTVKVWPMDPDLKKKWLKALRSGAYSQVDGALWKENEGHCCLGVLCDVYDPERWVSDDSWASGMGWALQEDPIVVSREEYLSNDDIDSDAILDGDHSDIEWVTLDEWEEECSDPDCDCDQINVRVKEVIPVVKTALPDWFMQEAQIGHQAQSYLIELNDSGASFDIIADFIEEYL